MPYACNPYNAGNFERNIVDAFVRYYQGDLTYTFNCRPDETCNTPAPDFKYCHSSEPNVIYIELGRITSQNLRYKKAVENTFKILCKNLIGKIEGSYILSINLDEIPDTTSKKKRDKLIQEVEEVILIASSSMQENEIIKLETGITLHKYANDGKEILPFVRDISSLASKDVSYLIRLFNEAGRKFSDFKQDNSTSLLILLHPRRLYPWSAINRVIKNLHAGLYGKQLFLADMIDGIYNITLDLEWQKDITVTECYPGSKTEGMGGKSQICNNQRDYTDSVITYFHGE